MGGNFFIVQQFADMPGKFATEFKGSVLPGTSVYEVGTNWPMRAKTIIQACEYLTSAFFERALAGRVIYRLTRPGKPEENAIFLAVNEHGQIKQVRLQRKARGKSYVVQAFDEGSQLVAVSAASA